MIIVSVAILTYNHSNFVEKTLDGILTQNTNFKIEIVIGDDASTDDTQKILKKYEDQYPDKFNIFYRKENVGMLPNFIDVLNSCSGKYIAFCEGDDFWLDPLKLQKQVDFLEQNPSYGLCFHDVMIYDETIKEYREDDITVSIKDTFDINDLAEGNFMHTPSVMLRNDFSLPSNFLESPIGDWPLYLCQIGARKIKKIEGKMAVYRVHENGVWSTKSEEKRVKGTINVINYLLGNVIFSKSVVGRLNTQKEELELHLSVKIEMELQVIEKQKKIKYRIKNFFKTGKFS